MAAVIMDIADHVRSNWSRASGAKGDYEATLRGGRIHVTVPLLAVDASLLLAFIYIFLMSFEDLTPIIIIFLLPALVSMLYMLAVVFGRPERPEPTGQELGTQKEPDSPA